MKLTVTKTLGKLRESFHGMSGQVEPEFNETVFHADKSIDKVYSHYGQYNENTIRLVNGDELETISVNGFEFSKLIDDVFYFQNSSPIVSHKFTINGRTPEGKLFEVKLGTDTEETLPSIIYAILFISAVKDVDLAQRYWLEMFGSDMNHLLVGDLLNDMIALNGIAKNMIKGYPFMELFLQQGLERIKKTVISRLNQLEILK